MLTDTNDSNKVITEKVKFRNSTNMMKIAHTAKMVQINFGCNKSALKTAVCTHIKGNKTFTTMHLSFKDSHMRMCKVGLFYHTGAMKQCIQLLCLAPTITLV